MATGNITVQHDKRQEQADLWEPSRFMRALFSWDPFGELGALPSAELLPAFDVKDTAEAFVFHADVPGLKEKDVEVQFQGNKLTVSGKRDAEQQKQGETFYTYERSYGSFARSFTLPDNADVDKASAEMKDGVLTISVPKRAAEKPRNVAIKS